MKIVVTGALGHIGSKLIRELPQSIPEDEIVMVDNLLSQRYCSLFNLPSCGNYRFVEADVLDADLTNLTRNADVVVHLAAITNAAASFGRKEELEHANFNATKKVAEICKINRVPMIFISSTSVYGTQKKVVDENCLPEDLQPQSPYAETKLKGERFLQHMGVSGDLKFIICRFGTICGVSPGMRFHTAVNKFCWQAVNEQPLTVWRTALNQKRPYLVLSDAVAAIKFIIRKGMFDGNIYNILTDNLTVSSIIEIIKKRVMHLDIQLVDSEIMNQLSYEVSCKRFTDAGFEFKGSMETNIDETIDLLRTNGGKGVKEKAVYS